MKVFVTRQLDLATRIQLEKSKITLVEWAEKREPTTEELIYWSSDVQGILSIGKQRFDRHFFERTPQLQVIALHSVGYDQVDLDAATAFGVAIGNTPGVLSKATADIAFLLMQNVARKAFYHHRRIINDDWGFFESLQDVGQDLEGKTLGIFGLGRIGFEMAKSAHRAFGMNIIYHNRSSNALAERELGAKKVSFETLVQTSDVLSLHANLTSETTALFDRNVFKQMKKTAIFINTARGGMHNEKDLQAALEQGILWGAGLDVTNPEPMNAANPLLFLPNTAILPHIGSATVETRMAMLDLCVKNLLAGLEGQPLPHIVNSDLYQV